MTARKKPAPDPWGAIQTTTLDNGQPVAIWENAATGEQRVVPQGVHPAQQPLAEVVRLEPDQEEIEESATDRVASILRRAHSAGGGKLKVYKIDKGSLVWCETYTPEQFEEGDLPMLRETFGPGDYELRLYGPNPETSKFGIIAKTRVVIAGALKTAPDHRRDDGLAQMLATIAEGQRAMLQALTERPAPKDPTEEMTKMLGLMVTMRQAMGIDAQPRSQITEIVSAIRELREASEEINPEKDAPDSLLGALPKVLEVVQAGMNQQQAQPQAMPMVELPPSMAAAPIPQPRPQSQPEPQPQPSEDNAVFNPLVILQLKAYLKTLLNMAQSNKPIEAGAQFVYDKMPDEIVELMGLDSWYDLLAEVAPECKAHKDWLTKVRDQAMGMFEHVDEGDEQASA